MKLKMLSLMVALGAGFAANARSILYYYDFDQIANGSLVYSGINRGSGTLGLYAKNTSGSATPYTTSGAFGSSGAFYSSSQNSLWLGDGSNSMGVGTRSGGFTMSMWIKLNSTHTAWADCFGWRLGGIDYRFEHTSNNQGGIAVYRNDAKQAYSMGGFTLPQGSWTHLALAFVNSTNAQGQVRVYINGVHKSTLTQVNAGDLQQIQFGSWVRSNGGDRKTAATYTGFDDFALLDYPITAEQAKWLAKYQPAQPAAGPGRAMPYAYLFHEAVDASNNGLQLYNGGTDKQAIYKWTAGYAQYAQGAHSANYCYWVRPNVKTSLRLDNIAGITLGTGFTLSFYVKSDALASNALWRDFLGFALGGRGYRLEWNFTDASQNPGFIFYNTDHGGAATGGDVRITKSIWHPVAMVWDHASKVAKMYVDGQLVATQFMPKPDSAFSENLAFTTLTIGPRVLKSTGDTGTGLKDATAIPGQNTYVDDVALFNYSFSPEQVAWLTNNVPNLPPLDATNLVRTVSANCAWAGTTAGWTVKDTTRRSIYPTLEDLGVTAAATFTANATLSIDTFVTAKEVSFLAGADATPTATLAFTNDARFEPATWNIGANVAVKTPLYALNTKGALAFGEGAKLVFDVANYTGANQVLTCSGMTFPAGTTDESAFFETTDPTRYAVVVAADRKSVSLKLIVAATAEWTRGAGTDDVTNPANWKCYDGDGEVLANALPCDLTTIVVHNGAICNFVPGQTPTYFALKMDAGAKLGGDCDWRGLGAVKFASGTTIDLGGHSLTTVGTVSPFETATVTDSVGGGALHVEVGEGLTITNSSVAFTGKLSLVKDGAGVLCVARPAQSYVGGTRVTEGLVKYGTANRPLGVINVTNTVENGATLDMNGFNDPANSVYSWKLAGTLVQNLVGSGIAYSAAGRCFGRDLILTGDATIRGGNFYFASPTVPAYFTSNGHALTIEASSYIGVGEWRDTDAGGTIRWSGSSIFEMLNGYGCTRTTTVFGSALIKLKGGWDVGGFEYNHAKWQCNVGTPYILVYGRYKAGTMRPTLRLQNGATLDLTQQTAAFNADGLRPTTSVGTSEFSDPGAVDFASGATVTIDVSGRTLTKGEQVVAWSAKPEGVTFVWDAATAAQEMPICVGTFGIYYGADEESSVVDRAEWVGGEDSDVANPANWSCYNLAGRAVSNGMPGEFATVYLTGAINLQIPRGKTLTYANIVCNNVSLAADCDWSGLTSAQEISSTIDLVGHHLTLPQLKGTGTITSSVAGGVLEVNVAEGLTLTNSTVTLTGAAKMALLKTGKGTLVMQKTNTGLGATTVTVREGYMKKWPETDSIGADGARVVVEDGAQFDLNGRTGGAYYRFTIAGAGPDGKGALVNQRQVDSSWSTPGQRGFLHSINLGADATIGGGTSWILASWNGQRHEMAMNNHTLTVVDSPALYTSQLQFIGPGKIAVSENSMLEVYPNTVTATNVTLEVTGRLQNRNLAMTGLDNLIFTATGRYYAYEVATAVYTVLGKYAPNTLLVDGSKMTSPRVQLGDATHLATTLDLNNFDESFAATYTTFYAGSTVAVDVSKRFTLANHERVVTWNAMPSGVNFVADNASKRRGIRVLADAQGLVVEYQGLAILVR